jgi:glycosyltransferase involved in cell wall biosynthesis
MDVLYHGALYAGTGYAEAARNAVLALAQSGSNVKTDPTGFAATQIIVSENKIECRRETTNKALKIPSDIKGLFESLRRSKISATAPMVVHAPSMRYDEFIENERKTIGYTAWETAKMPANWVRGCNLVDEIWIPCFHNFHALKASGVTTPIYVVPHAIDTDRFAPTTTRLNTGFTFISVFRWGLRKGWPELFTAFERAFTDDDPVTLRVLTNYRSAEYKAQGATIAEHFKREGKPRAELLPLEFVPYDFVPLLYQNADAFVLPSRGEGFCMPCAEAMACGLPAIVSNSTAFTDYVSESNGYPVKCTQVEADDSTDPDRSASTWFVADIDDLAAKMRRAFDNRDELRAKSERARATIQSKFGFEQVAKIMNERLVANGG